MATEVVPGGAAASTYRPDIDGLRAVAVSSVILFHGHVWPFGGGFVGVDVFFVISGFLIIRLIHGEAVAGSFRFANFYLRRVRRLAPALLVTLAACLVVGGWLLSPVHFRELAESTVYTVASASNFLFWRQAGYFDTAAAFKPLLHTWSLGVEEQFYLVWPALLVGLTRLRRPRIILACLALVCLVSLGFAQALVGRSPHAVFYLAPFRAFEFGIGALCVWLVPLVPRSRLLVEAFAVVGLGLILFGVFATSAETAFPGVTALPPCLGTALLVCSGGAWLNARLLASRPLVYVGLISYSLYLVHWPLFVFYGYWKLDDPSLAETSGLIGVSLVVASLLYRYVETPVRRPRRDGFVASRRGLVAATGLGVTLVVAPAAAIWASGGWPWRLPREVRTVLADAELAAGEVVAFTREHREAARLGAASGKPRVLVIGDSHGRDFFNALLQTPEIADRFAIELGVVGHQCQPLLGEVRERGRHSARCERIMQRLVRGRNLRSVDFLILSPRWREWSLGHLGETLRELQAMMAPGATLIVVGTTPEFPDVPTLVARHGRLEGLRALLGEKRNTSLDAMNARIGAIARAAGVPYHDKLDLVCDDEGCDALDADSKLLFHDYGHWTLAGARYFGRKMVATHFLPELLASRTQAERAGPGGAIAAPAASAAPPAGASR